MRVAYLDCASGISGDMMLGVLIDAGIDVSAIQAGIDSLGLPGCRLACREVRRKGFRALHATVEYEKEHVHRHLSDIVALIDAGEFSGRARSLAKRIFHRVAQAEARVHGIDVEKVHFHEVGAADSIADIVGTAIGLDRLGIDRLVASPIPTGCGFVNIQHGRCSVPAPATAELLRGIPLAVTNVEAELTTPTGAAIVAETVDEFGPLPAMRIESIGYGAGGRDLAEQANLLRLLVGETDSDKPQEQLWLLETNIDDASGEIIGHCLELLFAAGARDAYTTAVQMKKNRPGVVLTVLCEKANVPRLENILLSETTTLGVRRWPVDRTSLCRQLHAVDTEFGRIEGKLAWSNEVPPRFAPEYESCRLLAEKHRVPIGRVYEAAQVAFTQEDDSSDE